MPRSPQAPEQLPSIDYDGIPIQVIMHHGFSIPDRGPVPKSRILYAARDKNNERHWRSSLDEMISLIERGFKASALSSGVTA